MDRTSYGWSMMGTTTAGCAGSEGRQASTCGHGGSMHGAFAVQPISGRPLLQTLKTASFTCITTTTGELRQC